MLIKRNIVLNIITMIMPWFVKRRMLSVIYGYNIHPSARIGLSYIYPQHLSMDQGARIASLTIAIHLDTLEMGMNSKIGRGNWITGFPTGTNSKFFSHQQERKSELVLGHDSSITKNHHIDCTNSVHIGHHVTIAGYNSQLLTHSINVYDGRQDSNPIKIGDYSFVSTEVKILGGSCLPAYSVLAAGAVLCKYYDEEWFIYGGVPAKKIKKIPYSAKYFSRESGVVY